MKLQFSGHLEGCRWHQIHTHELILGDSAHTRTHQEVSHDFDFMCHQKFQVATKQLVVIRKMLRNERLLQAPSMVVGHQREGPAKGSSQPLLNDSS